MSTSFVYQTQKIPRPCGSVDEDLLIFDTDYILIADYASKDRAWVAELKHE